MEKLRDQYEAAGNEAIDKVRFIDQVSFECAMAIVPDTQGNPTPGWLLTLTLRHNMLLGKPPIIQGGAIPVLYLTEEQIGKAALDWLEAARTERDRQNLDTGAAQNVPAGLVRGKR